MNPSDQLNTWAKALRAMPELGAASVADVCAAVETEVRSHLAQGETPDGKRWPEKQDGGAPLERAQQRVTVEARGNVVLTTVTGPTALHHLDKNGAAPERQVIPSGLTPKLIEAVRTAVGAKFTEVTGGR
jgi:hypothetical protein